MNNNCVFFLHYYINITVNVCQSYLEREKENLRFANSLFSYFFIKLIAHQPFSCISSVISNPFLLIDSYTSPHLSSIMPEITSVVFSCIYSPISGSNLIIISATILAQTKSYFSLKFIYI